MDYQIIMDLVKEKINNNGRRNYPFRSRYRHTLRVLKWAERIQKQEGGDLEVITLACLFHDTGWGENTGHNIISREIADDYLKETKYDSKKREKVLEAVENHCHRQCDRDLSLESYIVMDADILDEVGALTILWDAMAVTYEDDPDYIKAYQRIKEYTIAIKERQNVLKTETGKKYYQERIEILDSFIDELEYELFL